MNYYNGIYTVSNAAAVVLATGTAALAVATVAATKATIVAVNAAPDVIADANNYFVVQEAVEFDFVSDEDDDCVIIEIESDEELEVTVTTHESVVA